MNVMYKLGMNYMDFLQVAFNGFHSLLSVSLMATV